MYMINKITANPTIDFAAEELKKYLRMMMPRCGEIPIAYAPEASDGFRLGLMADFGLDTSDADDVSLDDIVYIKTDEKSGIIAGSNPGALLIAVYRYLRFQGCRWLFPGIDGEYIPMRTAVMPVDFRKKADHRYRGQCNEGAESQRCMMETIDFTPKIGMNTYMIEFDIPTRYYCCYYNHDGSTVQKPEGISKEQVLKWKRLCEVEIKKRGLHFHDMGHGWTCEPFGLDSMSWEVSDDLPEETRNALAQLNGERKISKSNIETNVCMSNPDVRRKMVSYIADYAEVQNNVDFLHIWLADGSNCHCECDECRKKTPADWYIILLNEIDAELTKRGLDTHLVFIAYVDTLWAPLFERFSNNKRYTMLYAPISRKYTETYAEAPDMSSLTPFELNKCVYPKGMANCLAYLKEWQKTWKGDCFCYEYHFWLPGYNDAAGMTLAKVIYDDIRALKQNGLSGMIEDGSQRFFFPTGFPYYVYGETLFDSSVKYEDLRKDYFSAAFGENWEKAAEYLEKLSEVMDFGYIAGELAVDNTLLDGNKDELYNPEFAEKVKAAEDIADSFEPIIEANKDRAYRAQSYSWRLLKRHLGYAKGLAKTMHLRASGDRYAAKEACLEVIDYMSHQEPYIDLNYDMMLGCYSINRKFIIPIK